MLAEHLSQLGLRHPVTAVARHVEADKRLSGVGADGLRIRRLGLRRWERLGHDSEQIEERRFGRTVMALNIRPATREEVTLIGR